MTELSNTNYPTLHKAFTLVMLKLDIDPPDSFSIPNQIPAELLHTIETALLSLTAEDFETFCAGDSKTVQALIDRSGGGLAEAQALINAHLGFNA